MSAPAETLSDKMLAALPFTPLPSQARLMDRLVDFVSTGEHDTFILNGYAGTGKTSLTGAFVKALRASGFKTVLLAPTGRAAKVFSSFAGEKAHTIHKRILRGDALNPEARFHLVPNKEKDTIFLVDESSMISDGTEAGESLLSQLVRHIFAAPGCRLVLIGDTAQLPPVGQNDSPAMNPYRLRSLGLNPTGFTLHEPVRQIRESGILYNATLLRRIITGTSAPQTSLVASPFPDVKVVDAIDLEDELGNSLRAVGKEETIIITRSNWRANRINADLRYRLFDETSELISNEQLIITKNNYFWKFDKDKDSDFIANGETATVKWFGRPTSRYGKRFIETELSFPGHDELLSAYIMLDSLTSAGPHLSREEMNELYIRATAEIPGSGYQKMNAIRKDPFFNALQVKYAYCITCHKAQGGQWKHVYIDLAGIDTSNLGADYFRWLYTAVTRASERLYLVNPTVPVK